MRFPNFLSLWGGVFTREECGVHLASILMCVLGSFTLGYVRGVCLAVTMSIGCEGWILLSRIFSFDGFFSRLWKRCVFATFCGKDKTFNSA